MEDVQPADPVPDDRTPPDRTAERAAGEVRTEETVPAGSGRRPRDMAISLLVLLVPIALAIGVYRVVFGGDQPVRTDPAPAIDQARRSGAFPVLEPVGLGPDWHPVSATFNRAEGTLRIGYVTSSGAGAQLVESAVPPDRLLPAELTGRARPEGRVSVNGREWQWYAVRAGERALVLLEPKRTVIVVGSAGEQELSDLADALR
ncbi:DUF4245 domain-containing protein [Micromonospora zhanjiangensis]|uniref:DUF4245 domain-containing protein n=1 Tax=Micromonospora zhanjiangensis TaxID=1522057 RepID=A0ABV8KL33_9ACTN